VYQHPRKKRLNLFGAVAPVCINAMTKILKKFDMKNLQLIRLQFQQFLLHVAAQINIPLYLQLLWAALEKIFKF
jgi:hypothetical protein